MMGGISCGNVEDVDSRNGQSDVVPPPPPTSFSSASQHHRRSRSASDRKLDFAKAGACRYFNNNIDSSLGTEESYRTNGSQEQQSKTHQENDDSAIPKHRASLETDIEQLQMRLRQEKSVRILLEQALGRASSTLSPGHKHLTPQTRELISEIQLLEEEVANREQHVLSLYRSVFEQCVSGSPSAQCSRAPSPSHTKVGAKKHPHIISSAFCSSRKFPLQSFQVLSSMKDSGKKDEPLHPKITHQLSGHSDHHTRRNTPTKIQKTLSTARNSYMACTPTNFLYHCPSKLSEEMIRCMASIYCGLFFEEPEDQGKAAPILSRSSTESTLLKHVIGSDLDSSKETMVEISCISTHKASFSSTTTAIRRYRGLVEQLEKVNMSKLENKAKLAFWINVYNSLIMHAYLTHGMPFSSLTRMSLFRKIIRDSCPRSVPDYLRREMFFELQAAYNIGGHLISASTIEHLVLCCRAPRISRWFETILWTAMRKKSGEEKQILSSGFGLSVSQPLISFGLCTGASSDPPLKVYTAKHVEEELELAKKEFLQCNVFVKKSRKIFLPKLLDRYAKEISLTTEDLLTWVCNNVDKKLQESIRKCITSNSKKKKKTSQIIEWLPYNAKFRYVFNKNLTAK